MELVLQVGADRLSVSHPEEAFLPMLGLPSGKGLRLRLEQLNSERSFHWGISYSFFRGSFPFRRHRVTGYGTRFRGDRLLGVTCSFRAWYGFPVSSAASGPSCPPRGLVSRSETCGAPVTTKWVQVLQSHMWGSRVSPRTCPSRASHESSWHFTFTTYGRPTQGGQCNNFLFL